MPHHDGHHVHSGGMGAGGDCICLACGTKVPHRPGVPCREERCPGCGRAMLRENSPHHQAAIEKLKNRGSG